MAKKSLISRRSFLKKTALLNLALFLDACGGASGGSTGPSSTNAKNPYNFNNFGSLSSCTAGSTGSSNTVGYDGLIQVGTGGNSNRFVNGAGSVIQLRGCNMSGLENTLAQGWTKYGENPWGDGGGTPDWATYATWKPNVVRLPLNAASWLGLTCDTTTVGTNGAPVWANAPRNANHGVNYQQVVIDAVAAAQAIGCYVIIDLHWTAPKVTLNGVTNNLMPLGQSAFSDYDSAIPFWQSIANIFGTQATPPASTNGTISNSAIMFELFNEPYLNSEGGTLTTTKGGSATITPDMALLQGGWSSYIINHSNGGKNYKLYQPWEIAGYQTMLDTIRATGAQNICIVNGNFYTQDLTGYQTYKPNDSLNQIAFGWHPYVQYTNAPHGGYPYTNSPYYYPSCGAYQYSKGKANPASLDPANNILAAGYPVICTEDGGFGGTDASSGEMHMAYMQAWADCSGASYLSWMWDGMQNYGTAGTDNYLTVFASDGKTILPIQGEGQQTYKWMVNHT